MQAHKKTAFRLNKNGGQVSRINHQNKEDSPHGYKFKITDMASHTRHQA